MRIFVLGAGRMGTVIAQDLDRNGSIEIGIGDIDFERAKKLARRHKGARAYKFDVSHPREASEQIKGFDAVVNASWYELNLHAMKACMQAQCNYNDLGGLFHMTRMQMKLDSEVKKKGVTAIIGGGESPGITNLMCALAAKELETVESIRIFAGAKERARSTLNFPFSVSTVIDEYSKTPIEYIDGKYVSVPPLSGDEEVDFPSPVGMNTCHYSIHSEPATLPKTIGKGVRNVEFKLGISDKMVKAMRPLIELGMTSERKIPVNGTAISSKQFLIAYFDSLSGDGVGPERSVALRTVVTGTLRGKKRIVTCDIVARPKPLMKIPNATAYLTGVAGSIFGQLLARGRVVAKGVVPPESALDPIEFARELSKRGIQISKKTTSV